MFCVFFKHFKSFNIIFRHYLFEIIIKRRMITYKSGSKSALLLDSLHNGFLLYYKLSTKIKPLSVKAFDKLYLNNKEWSSL